MNVAVGAEQRRDAYVIGSGIPASYGATALDAGGAAAFQGFSTTDAGGHSRTNTAGYVDLAAKVVGGLKVDIAGRYEHYSDFGSARSGKFTARYDFTPAFALRGTASNGFRAPTVAEEYYTKSGTSPSSANVQFGANSPAAGLYGLGKLQPETSVNYSLGAVFTPIPQFTTTLDLYQTNLFHRIAATNSFNATQLDSTTNQYAPTPAYDLVWDSIHLNGNTVNPLLPVSTSFFTNAFDTKTRGADLVVAYLNDLGRFGQIAWSFNGNYNRTQVTAIRDTPESLAALGVTVVNAISLSSLTDSLPKYTLQFGGLWTLGSVSINLREIIHGSTDILESPFLKVNDIFHAHAGVIPITNLDISYAVWKTLRLSAGGTNIFNRHPEHDPLAAWYNSEGFSFGASQWVSSPIGFNGGYYYVKATYTL